MRARQHAQTVAAMQSQQAQRLQEAGDAPAPPAGAGMNEWKIPLVGVPL